MNYEEKRLVDRNLVLQERVDHLENELTSAYLTLDRDEREFAFLRAYATEAYEHGVSDGIDMGREFAESDACDEYARGMADAHKTAERQAQRMREHHDYRRGIDFEVSAELLALAERLRGDW